MFSFLKMIKGNGVTVTKPICLQVFASFCYGFLGAVPIPYVQVAFLNLPHPYKRTIAVLLDICQVAVNLSKISVLEIFLAHCLRKPSRYSFFSKAPISTISPFTPAAINKE